MAEPLARATYPDPLCECGERESCHLVPARAGAPRGACTFQNAYRSCKCPKFTAAGGDPQ